VRRRLLSLILIWILTSTSNLYGQARSPQLGKNSVEEVIAAMTTEEKVRLLVGMGFVFPNPSLQTEEDRKTPEKVAGAAGRTHAIPRLGIPSLTFADGPAGVRINATRGADTSQTYYATGFPIATLLASSWDTDLVNRVGVAMGSEVHDYGIDILLAPGMNIHRNPLGGRNFEYYSEDPLIAGKMAAAFVRGVQSNGVGTSIKHFAANNQEFNRFQSNSIVSERALREIYLKGFEIAVKDAQPWAVMSSYNRINGTPASESSDLLTTILRGEWGFKGIVMSDWWGGTDATLQVQAGNDLLMPGTVLQTQAIMKSLNDGVLSKKILDQNVAHILNMILQTPTFRGSKYSDQPDLKANADTARQAATEGMVLLKNDNGALPLASPGKVALFGNASYDLIAGGTGSGNVNKKYVISLDQGLLNASYTLDESLRKSYLRFIEEQKAKRPKVDAFRLPPPIPEMAIDANQLEQLALDANTAILTIGRNSGEFADHKLDDDFNLTATERTLIQNVAKAFHAKGKKVVVVLNIGGPIEVARWRSSVDAILLAWQPGQEGGNAVVDLLTGKVNPSGRLATTFPMSYGDVPSAKTFPGKELPGVAPSGLNPFGDKPSESTYDEGIYVGYRYYETFGVRPAYEFGYGLAYTNFSYGNLKLSSDKFLVVTASVPVTNNGKVPGKEVVQLYVSAPKQRLPKPALELKAFTKTKLLQPGESQTIAFTLSPRDLASFDVASSSWIVERGTYTIKLGASSSDIKSSATMNVAQEVVVLKSQKLLAPAPGLKEIER
jgi:beta-glucosidase